MPGLREEKKKFVRSKILDAALEIFLNEGYAAATTKKIACKADIGEGTIYNHFKSKREILITLYNEHFDNLRKTTLKITPLPGKSPKEYLLDFFDYYFFEIKNLSKEWLRELFLFIYHKDRESSDKNYHSLLETDEIFLARLREYLDKLKQLKIISPDLETDPLIEIIYSLLMHYYSRYAVIEEMSYEQFITQLMKLISYTLDKCLN
ncbi:MAG: TetR/AcrR family transcriptional regulator [Spirochaetes bacterium]|nr:TetR/AcrR family transcriptional regulator [Spirochaetota bacterium]